MVATYSFTQSGTTTGLVKLEWTKNGEADPLNFWYVEPDKVEEAKERVRAGELECEA